MAFWAAHAVQSSGPGRLSTLIVKDLSGHSIYISGARGLGSETMRLFSAKDWME